ncbi:MAG: iron ABC transporter substrate-binding protein [Rhodothermaceae bacterium]|nr:iron ABC transporter substrate-binding protein [Rhodothermaceae bacterium]
MKYYLIGLAVVIAGLIWFLSMPASDDLVVYSGRSKALVDPLIRDFEELTGITVNVRYGGTTQLAVALMEEGDRSPADLFWSQDAGALGAVEKENLLAGLPDELLSTVPERFRNSSGTWVATSGRARVLAYSTTRADADSVNELSDLARPEFSGRVGWAPSNGSFQAFVTAMQVVHGDEHTRDWLLAMKNNNTRIYNNNTGILQAIAAGEIDYGITNHYYLLRALNEDPDFPVAQKFFEPGDVGNLINVAGIGILNASSQKEDALRFVEFLLSQDAQDWFTGEVFEYPVTSADTGEAQQQLEQLLEMSPDVNLDALSDLESTLQLLREVGLL